LNLVAPKLRGLSEGAAASDLGNALPASPLSPERVEELIASPAARQAVLAAVQTAAQPAASPTRIAAAPKPQPQPQPRVEHSLFWPAVWTLVVALVLMWGSHAHLERYIAPQRGLGYWLGIIGGSMMLLLLLYSARKRASWLSWMGSIPAWFEFHMVLGVLGPVLVLFHANFSLGATNSNVALICMLLVAGSGVIGRYIYTRVHATLGGKEDTLEDLQSIAERIRSQSTSITFLPGLLDVLDREEQRFMAPAAGPVGRAVKVLSAGTRAMFARWRIHRLIRKAVRRAMNSESESIVRHADRIAKVARHYADRRLEACRRIAEYRLYARLFSLWHVLHIPLFFMLLIAGIVHVIAVNVY
jgi:hypothetical protein